MSEAADADAKDNVTPNWIDSMRARHSHNSFGVCVGVLVVVVRLLLADTVVHFGQWERCVRVSEQERFIETAQQTGVQKKEETDDCVSMRTACVTKRFRFFGGKYNGKIVARTSMYDPSFE